MRVAAYNKMRGGSGLARPTFCSLYICMLTFVEILYFPKLKSGMVGEYCCVQREVLSSRARRRCGTQNRRLRPAPLRVRVVRSARGGLLARANNVCADVLDWKCGMLSMYVVQRELRSYTLDRLCTVVRRIPHTCADF